MTQNDSIGHARIVKLFLSHILQLFTRPMSAFPPKQACAMQNKFQL
jgi:hypothetical protein